MKTMWLARDKINESSYLFFNVCPYKSITGEFFAQKKVGTPGCPAACLAAIATGYWDEMSDIHLEPGEGPVKVKIVLAE